MNEAKPVAHWPVYILALPAFVAIWGGWVSIGMITGFGVIHPLPGIADSLTVNTAITLPVGVEAYAAYAMYVWLSGKVEGVALRFARTSTVGALILGMVGQAASHVMSAAGWHTAPWPVTALVACLPVTVFGLAGALAHLSREVTGDSVSAPTLAPVGEPTPTLDLVPEPRVSSPRTKVPRQPRGAGLADGIMAVVRSSADPITVADLARSVGRSRSTVTYQLEKLINGEQLIMRDGRVAVAD